METRQDPRRADEGSRRFAPALALVVLVGAAVRFAYVWFDRRHVGLEFNDGLYYHYGANLLADGHGFVNPVVSELLGVDYPAADHPPLYLVYLSLFSLVGLDTVTDHLMASAALGVGSVLVAGLVGRRIGGDRLGLLAAGLVAVAPNVWRFDGSLLAETAVVFLVLVAVWLSYRFWDEPTPWRLVAVGAVVGLGGLARAEILLLVPLLVVPLALLLRDRPWKTRVGWATLSTVACVAVVAPWVGHNLARFDEPVLISSNLGQTIGGSYCETVFEGHLLGYWDYNCPVAAVEAAGYTEPGDERGDRAARDAGLTYAREHLGRLPVVVAARLGRTVGLYRPTQQRDLDALTEGTSSWVATAGMVTLPLSLVGAAVGAVVLHRRRRFVWPLLAPIACVLITVVVFYGATRFRATAEGPIYVLTAVTLDAVLGLMLDRRTTPREVAA